jgi:hypothetical protein
MILGQYIVMILGQYIVMILGQYIVMIPLRMTTLAKSIFSSYAQNWKIQIIW